MYLVDYHIHPYSHGELNDYNEDLYLEFINKAVENGIREIGFSDHDQYADKLNWATINYLRNNSQIPVLKALEFDYIPGREADIADLIRKYELDYAIGSVHFIDGWGFDNPDYIIEYQQRDIDSCYIEYYSLLKKAIQSNLFQIIGHFDLIKVFAYRPKKINILEIVNPILKEVKKYELVLEINTNGLNKPVKEIYPAPIILEKACQLKIPITFSSDAHRPERIGENIQKCANLAKQIGYHEIAVFSKGNISFKKL